MNNAIMQKNNNMIKTIIYYNTIIYLSKLRKDFTLNIETSVSYCKFSGSEFGNNHVSGKRSSCISSF